MNLPTPRNVTDVRSFMGLAGYYMLEQGHAATEEAASLGNR